MKRALAIVALVVIATGCGDAGSDEPITYPTGADDVVLQLTRSAGGPPPPAFLDSLRAVPSVTLYGDGRLVQPTGKPDVALVSLRQSRLSEEGVQTVLGAARDADLLQGGELVDFPGIFDAGAMSIVIHADGDEHVVTVVAPGYDGGDDPRRREEIQGFRELFFDMPAWLGAEVTPAEEIALDRVLVVVVPSLDPPFTLGEPEYRSWPLADLTLDSTYHGGYRGEPCFVATGPALEEAQGDLLAATENTVWQSGGRDHQVVLRPVLPHEDPCQ